MFKGAIFDLDGTVAYTIDDLMYSMNLMLADFGLPLVDKNGILAAINHGSHQFVRGCMPKDKQDDAELAEKCWKSYSDHYSHHFLDKTYLYEGLDTAIAEMKKRGYKLAVLSNKSDFHTNAIIGKLFPEGTFDIVLGHREEFPTKPDPTSALYICREVFGCEPEEVKYFGDSDVDMKTAVNAGMYPCGVSWGFRSVEILLENGAKKIIEKPEDVLFELD